MQLNCPKCGTRETRVARRQGIWEALKGMFGVYPLRCRRCRNRWLTSVWEGGAWKYARCPRCYRQDLTTWSEQYYNPPKSIVIQLRAGATPYRCATCRCNFASFKPCKEQFAWRHETKVDVAEAVELEAVEEAQPEIAEEVPSFVSAVSATLGERSEPAIRSAPERVRQRSRRRRRSEPSAPRPAPLAIPEPAPEPEEGSDEPFL